MRDVHSRTVVRLCPIALALVIAGCGGGGGGGRGGGTGGGNATGLTLSLSTRAVTFDAIAPFTAAPPSVNVIATFTGTANGTTLYVLVTPSDPNVATVTNILVNGTSSGQGTVVPGSPTALGVGRHTATITVRACLDSPTCATNQVAGSPQTIDVTYNVPGIESSVASLGFSIGDAPAAPDMSATFEVSGYPAQDWAATLDVDWLGLDPVNGCPYQIVIRLDCIAILRQVPLAL